MNLFIITVAANGTLSIHCIFLFVPILLLLVVVFYSQRPVFSCASASLCPSVSLLLAFFGVLLLKGNRVCSIIILSSY